MVFSNSYKEAIKTLVLNDFDNLGFIAFSDDPNDESATSDSLTGEIAGSRKAVTEQVKDLVTFEYEWDSSLSLTELNGEDISKIGLFTASSGDNLKISQVLTETISKTATIELNVGLMVTVSTSES